VHELVGSGGLSTIHRASIGDSEFALRRLHPGFETEWELVDAFMNEARLASELEHPHVARTLDYGKLEGTYYAACELVLGPTLVDILRQCRSAAGAIPVGVAVELTLQLCDVLAYLHGSPRIVYRGMAPDNVMVSSAGRVKLIDFGIAKTAARRQTRRGIVKGSLGYVAPESLAGDIDPRADLFAVGAIAHELLVGRPLFAADNEAHTLRNITHLPIQPPSRFAPDIPRELDDIVLAALERDRDQRWQSAIAMYVALGGVARALGGRLLLAQHTREWLAWAFARKPRRESPVRELIAELERTYA
jgi:serine/threonine protein kinase